MFTFSLEKLLHYLSFVLYMCYVSFFSETWETCVKICTTFWRKSHMWSHFFPIKIAIHYISTKNGTTKAFELFVDAVEIFKSWGLSNENIFTFIFPCTHVMCSLHTQREQWLWRLSYFSLYGSDWLIKSWFINTIIQIEANHFKPDTWIGITCHS